MAATGRPLPRCLPPRRSDPAAGFAAGGLSLRAALRCGRAYAAGGLSLRAAFRCGLSFARPPSRPPALSAARAYARPRLRPPALSPARSTTRRRARRSVSRALRGFRRAFAACRVPTGRPSGRRGCADCIGFCARWARGRRRWPRFCWPMLRCSPLLASRPRAAGGAARPPYPLALRAALVVLRRARCSCCACVVLARGHRFKPP